MKKVINVGDRAPVFQELDVWGNLIDVPERDKWFYLSFHRFAACPFCNLRTNELVQNYEDFRKRKVEIISIWPSDKESLLQFSENEKLPFPVLSDKNKRIYKAYGVTNSSIMGAIRLLLYPKLIYRALKKNNKKMKPDADPKLMPASFLINPDGIVKMAYYGKHFGDHPKIKTILNHIE